MVNSGEGSRDSCADLRRISSAINIGTELTDGDDFADHCNINGLPRPASLPHLTSVDSDDMKPSFQLSAASDLYKRRPLSKLVRGHRFMAWSSSSLTHGLEVKPKVSHRGGIFSKGYSYEVNNNRIGVISARSQQGQRWNVFRAIPRDQDEMESQWIIFAAQAFKVVVYAVLFAIVLGCATLSKLILLLMTSHLRKGLSYVPCKPYGMDSALVAQEPRMLPANSVTPFYWSLWVAICVPEILTFIRCVRIVCFKSTPNPLIQDWLMAFFIETAQMIGMCLLIFAVMPQLDSMRGAMLLSAAAVVPSFANMLSSIQNSSEQIGAGRPKYIANVICNATAFLMQSSSLFTWTMTEGSLIRRAVFVTALLLTSLHWWENYVSTATSFVCMPILVRLRIRLEQTRYKTHILISLWRCVLSLFLMLIIGGADHRLRVITDLRAVFYPFTSNGTIDNATLIRLTGSDSDEFIHLHSTVYTLMLWLTLSSLICYHTARFACKVKMELFSYAIPVVSVIPVTLAFLLGISERHKYQPCSMAPLITDKFFWNFDYGDLLDGLFVQRFAWLWLFWYIGYLWSVAHLFTEQIRRLNKTDALFVMPMYLGCLVDQSLALNRRRQSVIVIRTEELDNDGEPVMNASLRSHQSEWSVINGMTSLSMANCGADRITKIHVCATMWHETPVEMTQMLKSMFRLDEDQSARRSAQKYLKVVDPDYYELECHIFFDDAWQYDEELECRVPNAYVQQLVGVIDSAASTVHKTTMKLKPPIKFDVPYGGRLVWTMPGDNKLFVHLKDRVKTRHKKRWSQVMYMYYLLGHKIMELISDVKRKQVLADNTFLLAIDGDSKFSPSSVQKLVDLMKKNPKLGAACGRIHPIGKGILVWYQKFEYAIAHWFQKAAEHVFGCVLCAPGCFSLFRASALMDDNVVHKYTKVPVDPRHFVQYDQGEDRWLSTLLLKQGYRIEYAAAADAKTYAPEGFEEFFNQRRRWVPSSLANTLDLLSDYKRAVKNNDSISRIYIFYQMVVILFSLLGPSIIFTMMVFAQVASFRIDSWYLLWTNLIPIVLYCIVCFVCTSKVQLFMAKGLSTCYALVMMAVLVGTGIQLTTEGLSSPVSVYVMSLASLFCLAAIFHPKEMRNIVFGAVFFLMIPTTYVVMSLYALINLNVIHWGTREAAEQAQGLTSEPVYKKWLKKLGFRRTEAENGQIANDSPWYKNFSRGYKDDRFFFIGSQLDRLDRRLETLEGRLEEVRNRCRVRQLSTTLLGMNSGSIQGENVSFVPDAEAADPMPKLTSTVVARRVPTSGAPVEDMDIDPQLLNVSEMNPINLDKYKSISPTQSRSLSEPSLTESDNATPLFFSSGANSSYSSAETASDGSSRRSARLLHPSETPQWMKLSYLKDGSNELLDDTEHRFWSAFIEEYMKPIVRTPAEERTVSISLKNLRNSVALGILMVNGLLILIIYLLQINKELLSIKWRPAANYTIIKWDPMATKYITVQEPLKLEPIGFTIILFLSFILCVQVVGMILHRWQTLQHVLASTTLTFFERRDRRLMEGDMLEQNAVAIAKRLQCLDDEFVQDWSEGRAGRRVVMTLEKAQNCKKKPRRLDTAFRKRFFNFNPETHHNKLKGVLTLNQKRRLSSERAKRMAAEELGRRRDALLQSRTPSRGPAVIANRQPSISQLSKASVAVDTKAMSFVDEFDAIFKLQSAAKPKSDSANEP